MGEVGSPQGFQGQAVPEEVSECLRILAVGDLHARHQTIHHMVQLGGPDPSQGVPEHHAVGRVVHHLKGEHVETNRRKLGVIMGDHVKTGVNSVINIGTIIGENSLIGPGAIASGAIAPNSKIY